MDQFETEVTGLHPGTDYQIRNAVSVCLGIVPLIRNQLKKIRNFIFWRAEQISLFWTFKVFLVDL
jgi:hypothetical protein